MRTNRQRRKDTTMATQKTKPQTVAKATSRQTTPVATEPTKTPKLATTRNKTQPDKHMSILEAAARVLSESSEPLTTRAMIEKMGTQGYWSSPAGKTPYATLYAAILREIHTKGTDARFTKVDRGLFTLNAGTPAPPKTTGKKTATKTKPADGTPGPKAVSDLFQI
jgi:hypothetical protein